MYCILGSLVNTMRLQRNKKNFYNIYLNQQIFVNPQSSKKYQIIIIL